MDEERKYGLYSLIVGLLCVVGIIISSGLICYILYVIAVPSLLYGIGAFVIPKTRRKDAGKLPFRGY
jgi:energy-converting hydrogenase A subunit I